MSLYPTVVFTSGIYNKMHSFFSLQMFQPLQFAPLFCRRKIWIFVGGLCTYEGRRREKCNAKWIKTTTFILRDLVFNFLFNHFVIHKPMYFYILLVLLEDLHYSHHYLNVLNNEFELRWPFSPRFHQFHCIIKILHVFSIHLKERSQLLQNISNPRGGSPAK